MFGCFSQYPKSGIVLYCLRVIDKGLKMDIVVVDILLGLNDFIKHTDTGLFVLFMLFLWRLVVFMDFACRGWITLFGTFVHELCHFIVALILNGKPIWFSIIPRREGNMLVKGHVVCANITYYNALPIGLAPLLGLFPLLLLDVRGGFLECFLFITLAMSILPSSQDIRVVFTQPMGLLMYISLFATTLFIL